MTHNISELDKDVFVVIKYTDYHFRINEKIDLWTSLKYHILDTDERGTLEENVKLTKWLNKQLKKLEEQKEKEKPKFPEPKAYEYKAVANSTGKRLNFIQGENYKVKKRMYDDGFFDPITVYAEGNFEHNGQRIFYQNAIIKKEICQRYLKLI